MRERPDPGLAEILKEVRRIDVQSRRLVTNVMAGGYLSVFRGAGIEFDMDIKGDNLGSDTLMELNAFEARKMQLKQVDGKPTLFVESGGFNNRHPADWRSPWVVMTRR